MLLLNFPVYGQIYSSKRVYTYQYSIVNDNKQKTGQIKLLCSGVKSKIDSSQFSILWVTNNYLEYTGVIEKDKRIWLHPPRQNLFNVLEYSPFPEIRPPYNIGKEWIFKNSMGEYWANDIYGIEAKDILVFKYLIENTVTYLSTFVFIPLSCYKIRGYSTNISSIKTEFIGLFNDTYGFIEMVFHNIDGSTISFKLLKIE
jgi:hypothetical protein